MIFSAVKPNAKPIEFHDIALVYGRFETFLLEIYFRNLSLSLWDEKLKTKTKCYDKYTFSKVLTSPASLVGEKIAYFPQLPQNRIQTHLKPILNVDFLVFST